MVLLWHAPATGRVYSDMWVMLFVAPLPSAAAATVTGEDAPESSDWGRADELKIDIIRHHLPLDHLVVSHQVGPNGHQIDACEELLAYGVQFGSRSDWVRTTQLDSFLQRTPVA